jgi:hypothetical protein
MKQPQSGLLTFLWLRLPLIAQRFWYGAHMLDICQWIVFRLQDALPSGHSPGDIYNYDLTFCSSKFTLFANMSFVDVLPDGLTFYSAFNPTIDIYGTLQNISNLDYSVSSEYVIGSGHNVPLKTPSLRVDMLETTLLQPQMGQLLLPST